MNVEIGAEAAQFPAKEYINGIAVAVHVESKSARVRYGSTQRRGEGSPLEGRGVSRGEGEEISQKGWIAQRNKLNRGPPELVQHFRLQGEFTSAQERCLS